MKKFNYKNYAYLLFFGFLIASLFDMRYAIIAVICMVAPLVFALLGKGRYWCGNFCPRGNFYDNIMKKFAPKKPKPTPKFLKSNLFRAFMIGFMMFMFGNGISKNWGNLYGIGMVFYRLIVITSLIGIVLSLFFNHRVWCNFCPMGTLSSLIAKARGRKSVMAVGDSCISCNICAKSCPMGISPKDFKGGIIESTDCISCKECALKCPKSVIEFKNK